MRVRVFPTPLAAARTLAADVIRLVQADPRCVLGLPTGQTPILFYRELAARAATRDVDFSGASTFNLDEFLGLAPDDPRSYRAFMQRHLFDHVNFNTRRIHFLNGTARDTTGECRRYERAIGRAGGLDLLILGLGANGHVGFNEPGDFLEARTHRVRLRGTTRRANAPLFGNRPAAVPREALSMGIATILEARRIVLLATGKAKARCVERMIAGPITPRLPASFLQLHGYVDVWLDPGAAVRLKPDTTYDLV
jgi:glucosamine-6-phosphate deaminase